MKGIRIQKPDIKGTFQKLKNLKGEDVKAYWKARKARREMILEKRRNSAFAKKTVFLCYCILCWHASSILRLSAYPGILCLKDGTIWWNHHGYFYITRF